MTDPYLRGSATISDLEFLLAVARVRRPRENYDPRYSLPHHWVMLWDLEPILKIHPNRIRSKMRRMYNRKLIKGCNCGCRGDIEVLPAGERILEAYFDR